MQHLMMSTGQLATIACTLEVTIPKPGNVHRGADFEDTTLQDFLISAVAIGPILDQAGQRPLGDLVLKSVQMTRAVVDRNTNLGMILLLAPLAAVAQRPTFELAPQGMIEYLEKTTATDCQNIYQAIARCQPGGIGTSERFDVNHNHSPDHILAAMQLAESRDMIARQYVTGFQDVIQFVWPKIQAGLEAGYPLDDAVIQAHLHTMQSFPDSLIARKNGEALALQSAAMAGDVLSSGRVGEPTWLKAIGDFDFWLRADGNRRNPGTTADLIAAGLFVGLCQGAIDLKRASN